MFVQTGGPIVGAFWRGGFRAESGFDRFGELQVHVWEGVQRKPSTSPQEGVVNEHDKPLAGQQIAVGSAAIVGVSERLKRRNRSFSSVGDLLFAIELEVPMVMQGENPRQGFSGARWFEYPSVSSG